MTHQLARLYPGQLTPPQRARNEKERVQELFERAANFRSMARDIVGMADELEAEAMNLIGSSVEDGLVKAGQASKGWSHLVDAARQQYRGRRGRERYFDKKIFGEPAWDMLLELYASEINDEKVSTSNLILSSSSPSSTALRWIKHLEDSGMVVKTSSMVDGRVQYQRITAECFDCMTKYFESIAVEK